MSTDHSELVVALVAAVGTDVGMVADQVATELNEYGYSHDIFRLSDYLAELADTDYRGSHFDEELWAAMTEGDRLRQKWERDDALALQAVSDIVATREERSEDVVTSELEETDPANLERHAFILRSLKTPDELETLRAIYGPRLVVIGAYSPKDKRLENLAEKIERSRKNTDRTTWIHQPEALIERDEKEEAVGGQDVSGTFHRADFFVRAWDSDVLREDLERTIAILFGDPFRTPTRDEHGQFHAAGGALRSAELGRQVGAAITTAEGSLLALGANEVPKHGGGSHWDDEKGPGNRDFEIGDVDTNRAHLDELAAALTGTIAARASDIADEISTNQEGSKHPSKALIERLAVDLPATLRAGGLKDLTEFGRAVHAEMNALLDAARKGTSVHGATIYTTTFPCHNCARHIIGAGLLRVVFIEPYAKSRAGRLHEESISIDQSEPGERLRFEPFVGVAPRRYMEMFDAAARERLGHVPRAVDGEKQELDRSTALPVFVDAGLDQFRPQLPSYRAKELLALAHFNELSAETPESAGRTGDSTEASDPPGTSSGSDHQTGQEGDRG